MSSGFVHEPIQRRSPRVGLFNILCWIAGVVLAAVLLYNTGQLIHLWFIPLSVVVGLPIRDHGAPHRWILNRIRARRITRRNNGALQVPRLSRHGKTFEDVWDKVQIVTAAVRERDDSIIELPLLTTTQRKHLTVIIKLPDGASESWLSADNDGKFEWETRFTEGLARALAVTKEPDLYFLLGCMVRPSDRTYGYDDNKRRLNSQILSATQAAEAAAFIGGEQPLPSDDPYIQGDIELGKRAMARFDMVHERAGETTNYIGIRLPWPKNILGQRIKVEDPKAFMKSPLRKTMGKILTEFANVELRTELTTMHEVNDIMFSLINSRLLATRQTYGQRDREMVEDERFEEILHIDDTPGAGPNSWKPLSTTCDPDDPSYIVCDGTYIAAGYVDEIVKENVLPGFQESALIFSDDTYYTVATLCEAKPIKNEKRKRKEQERWTKALLRLNTYDEHLSDPDGEKAIEEIIKMRGRLSDSSTRTGEFCIPFTVLANSREELEARWEDALTQLSSDYEVHRVMAPNEIVDIICGQVGIIGE